MKNDVGWDGHRYFLSPDTKSMYRRFILFRTHSVDIVMSACNAILHISDGGIPYFEVQINIIDILEQHKSAKYTISLTIILLMKTQFRKG